ncbi:MAG: VCBS repeat-containing protein [Deltaproteobacteria bacterium]|nr:VCBS repeat-containing protein [Deltaproteobacteria bacterium]
MRVALAAMLCALAACRGCGAYVAEPPPPVTLEFSSPFDGAALSFIDDTSVALDGVQIDVHLMVAWALPGDRVTLVVGDQTLSIAAIDGDLVFLGVTLPVGEVTLVASSRGVETAITVTVDGTGSICDFIAPRDGDLLGTPDDVDALRPGVQLDLAIGCVGLAEGTELTVGVHARRPKTVVLDARGRAVAPSVDLAEGPNTLEVRGDLLPKEATADVVVDTGRCLAELQPPDGFSFLHDPLKDGDAGTLAPARQVVLSTTCADGSTATLVVDGTVYDESAGATQCRLPASRSIMGTVSGGLVTFADVPMYQNANIVFATVSEAGGREGRALDNLYVVDTMPPLVSFVAPDSGSAPMLLDDDPMLPGFQITARGEALGIEEGAVQLLRVTDADGVITDYEAEAVLANPADKECFDQTASIGRFTIPGVTLVDGPTELLFTVRDAAGNAVVRVITFVAVVIDAELAITMPSYTASPEQITLLTLQDDVDAGTPGLQAPFTVEIAHAAHLNGRPGSVVVPGQAPTFFTYSASPQIVPVSLSDGPAPSGIIDGIEATATLLNTHVVRSPKIKVQVDATAPFADVSSPRDGDVVPAGALSVVVQLDGEPQEREVRVYNGAALADSELVPAATLMGEQIFVTLSATVAAPGAVLRVEVDDRNGAKKNTTTLTRNVFVSNGAPTIAFTGVNGITGLASPPVLLAAPDQDADLTDGFDVRVLARVNAVPAAATVELAVTGTGVVTPAASDVWITRSATVPAGGVLDLSDIDFSLWANDTVRLWLRVTENATKLPPVRSPWVSLDVTVNAGANANRRVQLTSPLYGAELGPGSVTVSFDTDSGSKDCDLYRDDAAIAGASVVGSTATSVSFGAVALGALSDGDHTFLVRCTGGGDTFTSQRLLFHYRSSAPGVTFLDATGVHLSAPAYYFNALAPDVSATAGYQQDVTIAVGADDGTLATLQVFALPADTLIASATAPITGGQATFRALTLSPTLMPAGEQVRLDADVPNAFGALSATGSVTPLVDRVPPTVTLDACPMTIAQFNPFDDAGTFNAVEHRAEYTTTDVLDGALVTVTTTAPNGVVSATGPVLGNAADVTIAFPVPSPATTYTASFVGAAHDAADNVAQSAVCTPTIDPTTPVVSFRTPRVDFVDTTTVTFLNATNDDEDPVNAGVQASVLVTILNLPAGADVHLCSTANDPALVSAAPCAHVPGKVLASGQSVSLGGNVTQKIFGNVRLIDSGATPYGLAVEVVPMSGAFGVSPAQMSFPVRVDSVLPPTISSVTSMSNILANDKANPIVLQLGSNVYDGSTYRAEGTVNGGSLQIGSLTFTFPSATNDLATASVSSSLQGALAGTAMFSGNSIVFSGIAALVSGVHTLTLVTTTPSGNSRMQTVSVVVDLSPPVLLVAQPDQAPYTCLTPGLCLAPTGRNVDVLLGVADDLQLGGGCVCVRTSGTRCLTACSAPGLAMGSSAMPIIATNLAEGTNAVVGEAADGAGNVTVASAVDYTVDTLATNGAPVLEVSAVPGTCSSFSSSGCEIGFDDDPGECPDQPGDPGTSPSPPPLCPRWYASGVYRLTTSGTQTTACQIAGDSCAYTVRLLGEPLDASGMPLAPAIEVHASKKGGLAADLAAALIEALAPNGAPGLERATFWRLRLEARDRYGNFSTSAARHVELDAFSGAIVAIQRGFDNAPGAGDLGRPLQSGDTLGVRHNVVVTPVGTQFATDLRVSLLFTPSVPAASRCVRLTVPAASVSVDQVVSAPATNPQNLVFGNVSLPTGTPYTIRAELHQGNDCSVSDVIGINEVSGINTVNVAPSVTFDPQWLADAHFNAAPGATPGMTVRAIEGPGTEALGLLLDAQPAPGFQFRLGLAVKLAVQDANGGTAKLTSSVTTMTGTTQTTVAANAATFSNDVSIPTAVTAGAPATTTTQVITATVCNLAGDCATTSQNGMPATDKSLRMRVNVDPPAAVNDAIVCLGQSLSPTPAPADAGLYADDAACAALCAGGKCDARTGKAVLRFTSRGAAGGSVGNVAAYRVQVGITDDQPTSAALCNTLLTSGVTAMSALFVPTAATPVLAPGQTQTLSVTGGVPVHQRLCFAVRAEDDVGNFSDPVSVMRVSPLVPIGAPLSPMTRTGTRAAGDRADDSPPALDTWAGGQVYSAIAVGDMDGDGGVEIAVASENGGVRLYSSKKARNAAFAPASERFTPREIILPPPPGSPTAFAQYFGQAMAGGDFNGDGAADLAISAPSGYGPDGQPSGTVYIYYGTGDSSGTNPKLLREASCGFALVPTPKCPHVIIHGGSATLDPVFSSFGLLGWDMQAGHVNATNGPDDLVIADASMQDASGPGAFILKGGAPLFALSPPASTTVLDLRALTAGQNAAVTRLGPFNDCGPPTYDVAVAVPDMDGDGKRDVASSYGFFSTCPETVIRFYKGGAGAALQRCDTAPPETLLNIANVGRLSDATHDWLLVRSRVGAPDKGSLRALSGSDDFFAPGPTCTSMTTVARPNAHEINDLHPISAFGPSLDDSCNVTKHVTNPPLEENIFPKGNSAAPAGDFNGDGKADFFVGESGGTSFRSRLYVVTREPTTCDNGNVFRVIAEISGNASAGNGPGVNVFDAKTHAGAGASQVGAAGRLGSTTNSALWLWR